MTSATELFSIEYQKGISICIGAGLSIYAKDQAVCCQRDLS